MTRVTDRLPTILKRKASVITRAILWKIPHTSGREDICLKIGRYRRRDDLNDVAESLVPKSELTLDSEEFKNLIKYLTDKYEPFRKGVKAFIPLDRPFEEENAEQIKALFSLPDKQDLVNFILTNEIIPAELEAGLRQAHRARAVNKFEEMLRVDLRESDWQDWFQQNSWVLGSQFVRILDERRIDIHRISDFLMEAYDGFLDVVEIKRPGGGLEFWASSLDHNNYVPSADLTKAIAQATRYIYEVEREANSLKFLERVGGIKTVKPRCVLVFGRSKDWNDSQTESYRVLNASFHNLTVLTYDHVLARARRIAGLETEPMEVRSGTETETLWSDDIPF